MPEIIVFSGPCLAGTEVSELAGYSPSRVELRPPIQRGDVLRALCADPATLVILDGYYYNVRAVTHKEIVYALESGVNVVGAASMGALRAAELGSLGMIGAGQIFEWFRDGALDGDDEVAILHEPEDRGFVALTLALVEVRHAVAHLQQEGLIEETTGRELVNAVKSLPFTERAWDPTIASLASRILGSAGSEALKQRLGSFSLKRLDACRALDVAFGLPRRVVPSPAHVAIYASHHRELYLGTPDAGSPGPSFQQGWQVVQLLHPAAVSFVASLRARFLWRSSIESAHRSIDVAEEEHRLRELLRQKTARRDAQRALPPSELVSEARHHALALAARQRFGDLREVCRELTTRAWCSSLREPTDFFRAFEELDDLLPAWHLVRAFALSSVFHGAMQLAAAALEIRDAFRSLKGNAEIRRVELRKIAAELWGCPLGDVDDTAARRGLFRSRPFYQGLDQAVELIAVAERLPEPVNNYSALKAELVETPLEHVLDLRFFAGAPRAAPTEAPSFRRAK